MSKLAVPEVKEGLESSKLVSKLVTKIEIKPCPQSSDGAFRWSHGQTQDIMVNELDYNYDVGSVSYPFVKIDSTHDFFSRVVYREHLRERENFDIETSIDRLSIDSTGAHWLHLDQANLEAQLKDESARCIDARAVAIRPSSGSADTT
jgi:hypothetical protein